jgi:hypothetical protein
MDISIWGRFTLVWSVCYYIDRYRRGKHKPYSEKGQTIHWPEEKKWQTMIYETLHRKLKIGQHESTKIWGWYSCYLYHGTWLLKRWRIWIWCSGSVNNSFSTSGTCRVTVTPHELLNTEMRCWKFRSLLGTGRYKNVPGQNAPFYAIRSPTAIKQCLDMIGSLWL